MRFSPGDLTIELPEVRGSSVGDAVAGAFDASRGWAKAPLEARIEAVRLAQGRIVECQEELAVGIALETGKPITEARGEMTAVVAKFALTIEDAEKYLAVCDVTGGPHPALVRQRARGPAAVIAPYNFPLHLGNGALLAHLLAGNPVIFKPSPLAANVAGRYAALMGECFPAGVFNLVQGGAESGQELCLDPRVRSVCFTGSAAVGRALARALAEDFSKDLALELGGRNAAIICADADLGTAARAVADGASLTCGQRCNATSRVIVEESVAGEFIPLLIEALRRYQPGDPLDAKTNLGPLISAAAVERYRHLITGPGDWLLAGGVVGEVDGKRGFYVLPALRSGAGRIDAESFVPLLDLEIVSGPEQAALAHNASPFGLSASVFTRSSARFWALADELSASNIYANLPTTFSPSTLPFGGWGLSGNGRPGGRGFIRFTSLEQALQLAAGSLPD